MFEAREQPFVLGDRHVVARRAVRDHPGDERGGVTREAIFEVLTRIGGRHNLAAGLPGLHLVGIAALIPNEVPRGEESAEKLEAKLLLREPAELGGRKLRDRDGVTRLVGHTPLDESLDQLWADRARADHVSELEVLIERCLLYHPDILHILSAFQQRAQTIRASKPAT